VLLELQHTNFNLKNDFTVSLFWAYGICFVRFHPKFMKKLISAALLFLIAVSLVPAYVPQAEASDDIEEAEAFFDMGYEPKSGSLSFNATSAHSSFTGAFVYDYPISVPLGRNGVQPNLSLTYNNQSVDPQSLLGIGWSLEIPQIERLNKHGLDQIYALNEFSSSLSGEIVPVSLTDGTHGVYAAQVENGSFLIYEFNSNGSWLVTDKSGMTYTFGESSDSRQDDPDNSAQIYKWMLTSVSDLNGNTMTYSYTKDGGQIYPSEISYTGKGADSGIFKVEFSLEARPDTTIFFDTGFEVTTAYRLSQIQTLVNGSSVHTYDLLYESSAGSLRSLLSAVTETAIGSDGVSSSLPSTTFEYESGGNGWLLASKSSLPAVISNAGEDTDLGVKITDVNLDALPDFVNSYLASGTSVYNEIFLNDGDGTSWTKDSSFSAPIYLYDRSSNDYRGVKVEDVNADGVPDFLKSTSTNNGSWNDVYIGDGDGTWTLDEDYNIPITFYVDGENLRNHGVQMMDTNGDGLTDIVESYLNRGISQQNVYENQGDGTFVKDADAVVPLYFWSEANRAYLGVRTADVNGDSLIDFIQSTADYSNGVVEQNVYINQGDNTWMDDPAYTVPVYFYESNCKMYQGVRLSDVNGDGLVDILKSTTGGNPSDNVNAVYLNNGDGTGWTLDSSYSVPLVIYSGGNGDEGVAILDLNGDNLADFAQSVINGGGYQNSIYLNNGIVQKLTTIHSGKGGTITASYKNTPEYQSADGEILNPDLPFSIQTVSSVTTEDGLTGTSTVTYDYSGGKYYYANEFDRQFAGFATITKTESARITKTYYLQDERAKIGQVYKTEIYDNDGNLYSQTVDTWATKDLGYDNDYVYKTQTATMAYDGKSSHRDIGTAYTYDSYGNTKTVTSYGEVDANEDGTFTDITDTDEKFTVTYGYATDAAGKIRGKVSEERIKNSSGGLLKCTRYLYDSLTYGSVSIGNRTQEARWNDFSSVWHSLYYTYNSYGLVTSVKNPRGYTTTYTYDSYNLYPSVTKNAKSYTVTTLYDYASGKVTSYTDENGATSKTSYDGFGRALIVSVPDPTTGVLTTLSTSVYDDTSVPNSVTTTATVGGVSSKSVTYSDGVGRKVQTNTLAEDGVYNTVDTWYDEMGNVSEQSLPYQTYSSIFGRDSSQYGVVTTYDALSRPLTVTAPTGITTYGYSQWENTVTDANEVSKVYEYDAGGHLLQVEEQNEPETYATVYAYDPLGELTKITDAQGNLRNFDYDSLGRKISQEDLHAPSETSFGTWRYTYDKNNNMLTQTDPAGQVITWVYDALDRVSYEDWDVSTTTRDMVYVYDSATNGKMKLYKVTSNFVDTAIVYPAYDYLGSPTKEVYYFAKPELPLSYYSYTFQTTHDLLSRPTKIIYPSSALTVNYTYNASGVLEKITNGSKTFRNIVSDFDYSPAGQVTSVAYGNGTTTTNTYDPAESYRLMSKVTNGTYLGASGFVQNLAYTYDAVGNITGIVDASITSTAKILSYGYDDLNRLLSVASSGFAAGDFSESYEYDEVGNILSKSDVGTLTYAGTGGGGVNPHAVTSVAGTAYTYDLNGNLTSNGAHSYSWDKRNRLSSSGVGVADGSGISAGTKTFYYDFSGSRYKTVDTSSGTADYTYYVGSYEELRGGTSTSAGTPTYYIFAGGQRVASLKSGVYTYYHQDHLGGTALATDSAGAVVQLYDYYPYGSELMDSQPTGVSVPAEHSFTDKELDDALGLYYFEARWYDSEIGRFSSEDPAQYGDLSKMIADPQSLNFYAYSRNNPVNLVDPSGKSANPFTWDWGNIGNNFLQTLDAVPIIGDISDVYSCVTGKTLFTQTGLTEEELGLTAIMGILPVVTGGQVRMAEKALEAADDVGSKIVKNLDGGSATVGQVLDGAVKWLGDEYDEISDGVFRSADNSKQFRMTESDLTDVSQGAHVHFEAVQENGKDFYENSHVKILDE
jgi:RHS repeat-associated protein